MKKIKAPYLRSGLSIVEVVISVSVLLVLMLGVTAAIKKFSSNQVSLIQNFKVRGLISIIKNDCLKKDIRTMADSSGDFASFGNPECRWTIDAGEMGLGQRPVAITITCDLPNGKVYTKTESIVLTGRQVVQGGGSVTINVLNDITSVGVQGVSVGLPDAQTALVHHKTTDASGKVVFTGVAVGPSVPLVINTADSNHYFSGPPPTHQMSIAIAVTGGANQFTYRVMPKRKVILNFKAYSNGTTTDTLIAELVRFFVDVKNAVTGESISSEFSTATGISELFLPPCELRITPMFGRLGATQFAGMDRTDSHTSRVHDFVTISPVTSSSAETTLTYHMAPRGSITGNLREVDWSGTEFILTGNNVSNYNISCYQRDWNIYTDDTGGSSADMWNTRTGRVFMGGSGQRQLVAVPGGSYTTSCVPFIASRNPALSLANQRGSFWCEPSSPLVNPIYTPIFVVGNPNPISNPLVKNSFPASAVTGTYFFIKNTSDSSLERYPKGATHDLGSYRARFGGFNDSYNSGKDFYVLRYNTSWLAAASGSIMDSNGNPLTQTGAARVSFFINRHVNNPASRVVVAGGKVRVEKSASVTIPAGQSSYSISNLLPLLGNDVLSARYEYGSQSDQVRDLYSIPRVEYQVTSGNSVVRTWRENANADDIPLVTLVGEYKNTGGSWQTAFTRTGIDINDGAPFQLTDVFKYNDYVKGDTDTGEEGGYWPSGPGTNATDKNIVATLNSTPAEHQVKVAVNASNPLYEAKSNSYPVTYKSDLNRFESRLIFLLVSKVTMCMELKDTSNAFLGSASVVITRPRGKPPIGLTTAASGTPCPFDTTFQANLITTFYATHSGGSWDYAVNIAKNGYNSISYSKQVTTTVPPPPEGDTKERLIMTKASGGGI